MTKKRSNEHIRAQKAGKALDANMCFLCGSVQSGNHGHHIILYSEGGVASTSNIMTLCPGCHRDYHAGKIKIDIGRF